jgi:hypothetical protein
MGNLPINPQTKSSARPPGGRTNGRSTRFMVPSLPQQICWRRRKNARLVGWVPTHQTYPKQTTQGSARPPGGRTNTSSRHFMVPPLPQQFCWQHRKSARPRGRSGAARRRVPRLDSGQYQTARGKLRRSNILLILRPNPYILYQWEGVVPWRIMMTQTTYYGG